MEKRRGRVAAAKPKMQENLIDSTTEVQLEEQPPLKKIMAKKNRKGANSDLPLTTKDTDNIEVAAAPAKRTKTTRKDEKPIADKIEKAENAKSKKVRGKKIVAEEENKEPTTNGDSPKKTPKKSPKSTVKASPVAKVTKSKAAVKKVVRKVAKKESVPELPELIEKVAPKRSRAKAALAPSVENGAQQEKEASTKHSPAKKARKGKAVDEVVDIKVQPAPVQKVVKSPVKRGRGKVASSVSADNKNGTTEVPKEKPAPAKRGGKKVKSEEPIVEPEDEPPVKQRKVSKKIPATDGVEKGDKTKKKTTVKASAIRTNNIDSDYTEIDCEKEKSFLKIATWNVAGLRAWVQKGGLDYFEYEKPDIICLQETKCLPDDVPEEAKLLGNYHPYWLCKSAYAGIAIYSKIMPMNIQYGLGDDEQDTDGRLMTAEYEKFYLVCVYVPNAGRNLVTLPKRLRWDEKFQAYLKDLDQKKPVILCGDMNVAHEEIDLANPKSNRRHAGFTQEERDGMTKLLSLGFIDTFRSLYPKHEKCYTFWSYMGNARAKNVGWRLDYFILSERLRPKVSDVLIRSKVKGSDHCPSVLLLENF